ncbi:DUF2198 family protein [Alkalihalobacterium bogoriense]|uniref:DUF2198 family protein n=1 Tax=Alkalihalobacterium bogoriense TaxID=246272 RepID=UPI000478A108|nr:DUF2198 family protein [Alkalihalobacterium bogoriense]
MVDVIVALVLPFIIMVLVTRVAFSLIGAFIVTFMIMFVAVRIHEQTFFVIALACLSLYFGWMAAKKLLRKKPGM